MKPYEDLPPWLEEKVSRTVREAEQFMLSHQYLQAKAIYQGMEKPVGSGLALPLFPPRLIVSIFSLWFTAGKR